jgi:hypothetical protein
MRPRRLVRWPRPVRAVRRPRGAAVLAWSLWVLWLTLSAVSTWFWIQPEAGDAVGIFLAGYATVGALVASRHPRNAVGWLLIAFALAVTVRSFGEVYVSGFYPGYPAVAWMAELVLFVPLVLILVFVPMVFPEGRLLSRRWLPAMWLGAAATVAFVVGAGFGPGPLDLPVTLQNPLGVRGPAGQVFADVEGLAVGLLVLAGLLAAASLVLRFLRSRGMERQQLKWFTFVVILQMASFAIAFSADLLPYGWSERVNAVGWTLLLFNAVFGIPVATAIAIFRHHLYDIDLVINRTLVYGSLTAALLAIYVGSVVVLGRVLSPVVGGSDLAVAVSTLAVAALFRPARTRIQRVVDRRFYRRRYDATRALDEFTARLRDQLDLDAVGVDLCAAADESVQPGHVSLWLRP